MVLKKISELTPKDIASICDHTYLNRPEAFLDAAKKSGGDSIEMFEIDFDIFLEDTLRLSQEGFSPYAVCVRPETVSRTRKYLDSNRLSKIKVASVIGFPNTCDYDISEKIDEIYWARDNGAVEFDPIIRYDWLKSGRENDVRADIHNLLCASTRSNGIIKLIFENSRLTKDEIKRASRISEEEGVNGIKTASGFAKYGARSEDIKVMVENFPRLIKFAGGVDLSNYEEFLQASARRTDGYIDLDPMLIRIGESKLLKSYLGKS